MNGSKWRKWDLHFHTPSSYDYTDKSITNQNIIDNLASNNVEAVAITDHHVIDIERIKDLQKLGKGKITVLPGIEFLSDAKGKEPIHFIAIFDENCDLDFVWGQIKNLTSIKRMQSEGKKHHEVYCDLADTIKLIKELNGIVTIHAGSKSNSFEAITHSLSHGLAQKEDIASAIDIFELGQEKDFLVYKQLVLPHVFQTTGKRIPTIICSDNHNVNSYVVKQNLWIKAEPTFEGLRQILHEPNYRVYVGDQPPINPLRSIDTVVFDFPPKSSFDGEPFCFTGKSEIRFSPNFTCVIGGRGTGKSTLLNLIHEKLKPGENTFFKSRKIKDENGKPITIGDCIKIDDDDDEKQIEFLSQNEIEEFAQNYTKLTNAIYTRLLKSDDDGTLSELESSLEMELQLFKRHTININSQNSWIKDVAQLQKEKASYQKIVDSFSSTQYKTLSSEITELTKKHNEYLKGKADLVKLTTDFTTITKPLSNRTGTNYFDKEINRITGIVDQAVKDISASQITIAEGELADIEEQKNAKQSELRQYLASKGVTQDNLNDISNASTIIAGLETQIEEKLQKIKELEEKIIGFDKTKLSNASLAYKSKLETKVTEISKILEGIDNPSIKPISLNLDFDEQSARNEIFNNFKALFEGRLNQSNHKGDNVLKDILFCLDPKDITDKQTLLTAIKGCSSTSSAKAFLYDLFQEDSSFEAYKCLCERNFLDHKAFKKINVLYDGRPVEISSFGQRCTAVLVILLLLGNNPIIIDEPEAHLDSLLIANYLVDVIKQSKQNRQIIFTTHNANFVVNGDAEYIQILSNDENSGFTILQGTTIENTKTRNVLVSLEGGKEAFYKRENKYQFLRKS